jgi:very-short-patch-repair endonuclease
MWQAVQSHAGRRDGVVSHAELRGGGVPERTIYNWLERGRLVRLHRGVYAVARPPETMQGRALAALLAVGRDAVLNLFSAAALCRIGAEPVAVHLSTPRALRSRPGIVVHHAAIAPQDIQRRDGLPLTAPARTLVDLAAVLAADELRRAVAEALYLRLTSQPELERTLIRLKGHRGAGALAALIGAHEAVPTRSRLERALLPALAAAGLATPRVGVHVGPYLIDFLWTEQRVAVETDGFQAHGHRLAFEDDRARDADLQARGYAVLRFTWRQVLNETVDVVDRIGRVLLLRRRARDPVVAD